MIKRMVIMLVLVGVVLGGVFGFKNFVNGKIKEFMSGPMGPGNAPQTVSTTKAAVADWQQQLSAVGTLRAVKGADLSIELAGVVDEINFDSGQDVEAGKVLLRLRNDDDVAKLKSLEAIAELSEVTYDRDLKQFKAQAVSQAVIDNGRRQPQEQPGPGRPAARDRREEDAEGAVRRPSRPAPGRFSASISRRVR